MGNIAQSGSPGGWGASESSGRSGDSDSSKPKPTTPSKPSGMEEGSVYKTPGVDVVRTGSREEGYVSTVVPSGSTPSSTPSTPSPKPGEYGYHGTTDRPGGIIQQIDQPTPSPTTPSFNADAFGRGDYGGLGSAGDYITKPKPTPTNVKPVYVPTPLSPSGAVEYLERKGTALDTSIRQEFGGRIEGNVFTPNKAGYDAFNAKWSSLISAPDASGKQYFTGTDAQFRQYISEGKAQDAYAKGQAEEFSTKINRLEQIAGQRNQLLTDISKPAFTSFQAAAERRARVSAGIPFYEESPSFGLSKQIVSAFTGQKQIETTSLTGFANVPLSKAVSSLGTSQWLETQQTKFNLQYPELANKTIFGNVPGIGDISSKELGGYGIGAAKYVEERPLDIGLTAAETFTAMRTLRWLTAAPGVVGRAGKFISGRAVTTGLIGSIPVVEGYGLATSASQKGVVDNLLGLAGGEKLSTPESRVAFVSEAAPKTASMLLGGLAEGVRVVPKSKGKFGDFVGEERPFKPDDFSFEKFKETSAYKSGKVDYYASPTGNKPFEGIYTKGTVEQPGFRKAAESRIYPKESFWTSTKKGLGDFLKSEEASLGGRPKAKPKPESGFIIERPVTTSLRSVGVMESVVPYKPSGGIVEFTPSGKPYIEPFKGTSLENIKTTKNDIIRYEQRLPSERPITGRDIVEWRDTRGGELVKYSPPRGGDIIVKPPRDIIKPEPPRDVIERPRPRDKFTGRDYIYKPIGGITIPTVPVPPIVTLGKKTDSGGFMAGYGTRRKGYKTSYVINWGKEIDFLGFGKSKPVKAPIGTPKLVTQLSTPIFKPLGKINTKVPSKPPKFTKGKSKKKLFFEL